MTFAQELWQAVTTEYVADTPPPPIPSEWLEPDGTISFDFFTPGASVDHDVEYEAWLKARRAVPKDPGLVRVLEVSEGFDEFLAMCRGKDVFNRPVWKEMALFGDTDTDQLKTFLGIKCPFPERACLWTQGTHFRLFIRTSRWSVFFTFVVGEDLTEENSNEAYRALYDVGIREVVGALHRTASPLRQRAELPAEEARLGGGILKFEDDPGKRYITTRRFFMERP